MTLEVIIWTPLDFLNLVLDQKKISNAINEIKEAYLSGKLKDKKIFIL